MAAFSGVSVRCSVKVCVAQLSGHCSCSRGLRRSLIEVSLVVDVVQEWHNDLVPAWEATVSLHGDQIGQPSDVLDLLLLELQVAIEAPVVELLLEGHRELPDRLFQHYLI